tara:strand:- start:605 stop:1060 length:456 start_codon:yes stop_codon:yes gene_type:complete
MKNIYLIKHSKGALGLRLFGLGPKFYPCRGLKKLKALLDKNTFWAQDRNIKDLKKCLENSDVVISLWMNDEIVGFGRGLTDGIYRGVLWDIVIDQNFQGYGFGKLIIKSLLENQAIQQTEKVYLMTSNKKDFYCQFDFKEVETQCLLLKEI